MQTDYVKEARSDASDMATEFIEKIVESYLERYEGASKDVSNDYDDSYHHETHTDKDYDFTEAAAVLSQLSEFEETDSGLWEGQDARKMMSSIAAYTYGNAVMSHWDELIDVINDDDDLEGIKSVYEAVDNINLEDGTFEDAVYKLCKEALEKRIKLLIEQF